MLVKDIFAKATSENKSLTWEEFEAIAKESKAKFTDLSEGKYVDRQKYEDDLAKKDTEITSLNDTITTRNGDLEQLKTQLANAGNDAGKLDELTNSLTALQAKYDADTAALNTKLSAQAYEFAVRDYANKQKFSSEAARRDFTRSMIDKKLPMEDVADEMLAILSDRNRIMQKKELEITNAKWNEYLNERYYTDNDE